jgi:DNA-directed RNA polymerase subunit RPC12/RpoP
MLRSFKIGGISMAYRCANCGSANVQQHAWTYQCLDCGKLSDFEGNVVENGAGASTRDAIERRLQPRRSVVVGNFADLQRMGAELAATEKGALASTVVTAEPVDVKSNAVVTPHEDDAMKADITRETVRTGEADPLIEEQNRQAAPRENREPNPVDPTSQSPLVESTRSARR